MDGVGLTEVDLVGCHQANACVMMVFIVPGCEPSAEGASILDGFEAFGELWLIFQCLEVGLPKTGRHSRYAVGCGILPRRDPPASGLLPSPSWVRHTGISWRRAGSDGRGVS